MTMGGRLCTRQGSFLLSVAVFICFVKGRAGKLMYICYALLLECVITGGVASVPTGVLSGRLNQLALATRHHFAPLFRSMRLAAEERVRGGVGGIWPQARGNDFLPRYSNFHVLKFVYISLQVVLSNHFNRLLCHGVAR